MCGGGESGLLFTAVDLEKKNTKTEKPKIKSHNVRYS